MADRLVPIDDAVRFPVLLREAQARDLEDRSTEIGAAVDRVVNRAPFEPAGLSDETLAKVEPAGLSEETNAALAATFTPFVEWAGADADSGPALQAALDAYGVVQLRPGKSYKIQTPVFLDAPSNSARYTIYANGATIALDDALPGPSTWVATIGATPPTAFFNGTLRSALAGSTVDTSSAGGCTNAPMGARLVIHDAVITSGSVPGLVVFGGTANNGINGAASGLVNCVLNGLRAGISWSGYADGNFAENVTVGSNPTGGGTRVVYQRSSGDSTRLVGVKAYGGYIADIASAAGCIIESPVSGQINLVAASAQISAGHQETDEISSAVPWSLNIDRAHVTLLDHYSRAANIPTHYSVQVNDTIVTDNLGSELLIKGWRAVANYNAGQGDSAKGPSLQITSLGQSGRVRVENSRGLVIRAGSSAGVEALWVASADSGIQAALNEGIDHLASGNWVLSNTNGWRVGPLGDARPAPRRLMAPSVSATPDTVVTAGSLTSGTTYEYVAAVKTASGGYSPLSATVQAVATAGGSMKLTLTNPTGPVTVALWRKSGAGVTTAPGRYVEIGLDANATVWVDTGANVNGRPWKTAALPIPSAVAVTGPQSIFPTAVVKSTNQTVNGSNTLAADRELAFPLAAGATYRFRCVLFYDSGTAPDFKAGFDVPDAAALAFGQIGAFTGATGNSGSVSYAASTTDATQAANLGGAGVGTRLAASFEGTVVVGATAGTLQLVWSQANADASDTTVYAGSFLTVERLN